VTLNHYAPGGESRIVSTIGAALWVGVADVDGFSLELVPDVVVDVPSVANGGLVVNGDGTETVEFVIDPAAVWADGTPISGEDFRFTYEAVMDPGYGVDRSGYEDIVPGSVVVGEKSFRFTLSRPSLVVESLFGVLLPAHVVAGTDLMADWNDRMWVSGGPFEFESWTPGTEEDPFSTIILTRNDAYWKVDGDTGQQLPFLDRVVFRFVGDVDTLVAEFEARRLDVITPGADPVVLDGLAALPGVVVDVVGNGQWEHLSFQFGEGRLTRNPDSYNSHIEFRRAVAHAIDRDRVAEELFGSWGVAMDSYLEAFTPAWSQDAWAQYDYDPDAARTALAELCAKPGIDCTANPPSSHHQRAASCPSEVLEPMFTDVGTKPGRTRAPGGLPGETIEYGTRSREWSWGLAPAGEPGAHRSGIPTSATARSNHYRLAWRTRGNLTTSTFLPLINESSARMRSWRPCSADQGATSTVDRAERPVAEAEQTSPTNRSSSRSTRTRGRGHGRRLRGTTHPTGGGDTWNTGRHRIDAESQVGAGAYTRRLRFTLRRVPQCSPHLHRIHLLLLTPSP
jgi:hypothetical protein